MNADLVALAERRRDRLSRRLRVSVVQADTADDSDLMAVAQVGLSELRRLQRGIAGDPSDNLLEWAVLSAAINGTDRRELVEDLAALSLAPPEAKSSRRTTDRWGLADAVVEGFLTAAEHVDVRRIEVAARQAQSLGWRTPPELGMQMETAPSTNMHTMLPLVLDARDEVRSLLHDAPDLALAMHAAPEPWDDVRWSALYMALTWHEYSSAGLKPPVWTEAHSSHLDRDWEVVSGVDPADLRSQTPNWLAARHILLPGHMLETGSA